MYSSNYFFFFQFTKFSIFFLSFQFRLERGYKPPVSPQDLQVSKTRAILVNKKIYLSPQINDYSWYMDTYYRNCDISWLNMTSGPYKSIIFSALFLYSIIFLNILCSPLQYLLCVIHMLLCMLLAGMYKSPDVFYNFICLCSIHPCHFKCYNACDIV